MLTSISNVWTQQRYGLQRQASPRFGKNTLSKLILSKYVGQCAYCSDPFMNYEPPLPGGRILTLDTAQKDFNFSWPSLNQDQFISKNVELDEYVEQQCRTIHVDPAVEARVPTYDHIQPENGFAPDETINHNLENGLLACKPCNNDRGNIPLLEYLNGETRSYQYYKDGLDVKRNGGLQKWPKTISPEDLLKRREAFSSYLKTMMEGDLEVPASRYRVPWIVQALDPMLFPVWKEGNAPKSAAEYQRFYKDRVKQFIRTLAAANKEYWLGNTFERRAKELFKASPEAIQAVLEAVEITKKEMGGGIYRLHRGVKAVLGYILNAGKAVITTLYEFFIRPAWFRLKTFFRRPGKSA